MIMNGENERRLVGVFDILGESLYGEIIYDQKNGKIILDINKPAFNLDDLLEKNYDDVKIIVGKINSGERVTLYGNRCVKNHFYFGEAHHVQFKAKTMLISNGKRAVDKFNKFVFALTNALTWSGLSSLEVTRSLDTIKINERQTTPQYELFGAKVTFSTTMQNQAFCIPQREEIKITERLLVTVQSQEEKDAKYFLDVRDRLIALISFAVKNNVNPLEQYFTNYGDAHTVHFCYCGEKLKDTFDLSSDDYNFNLSHISFNQTVCENLYKLIPVFNLYLSIFQFDYMPTEMIFLNIVQALETFHARFFYDDDKDEYIKSVLARYQSAKDFPFYKKLLLSDTQTDENCRHINLVSRLNDLFVRGKNKLFYRFFENDLLCAQTIASTRHYYTHYNPKMEKKALKGEELTKAVSVLRILLEYHVCAVLNVDNAERFERELDYKFPTE